MLNETFSVIFKHRGEYEVVVGLMTSHMTYGIGVLLIHRRLKFALIFVASERSVVAATLYSASSTARATAAACFEDSYSCIGVV